MISFFEKNIDDYTHWVIMFYSVYKTSPKISYENNVTFNKSLYIGSPTTANIITAQGGSLSSSIEVENFLINTTYSPQTNITSFGSNNLENTTKLSLIIFQMHLLQKILFLPWD